MDDGNGIGDSLLKQRGLVIGNFLPSASVRATFAESTEQEKIDEFDRKEFGNLNLADAVLSCEHNWDPDNPFVPEHDNLRAGRVLCSWPDGEGGLDFLAEFDDSLTGNFAQWSIENGYYLASSLAHAIPPKIDPRTGLPIIDWTTGEAVPETYVDKETGETRYRKNVHELSLVNDPRREGARIKWFQPSSKFQQYKERKAAKNQSSLLARTAPARVSRASMSKTTPATENPPAAAAAEQQQPQMDQSSDTAAAAAVPTGGSTTTPSSNLLDEMDFTKPLNQKQVGLAMNALQDELNAKDATLNMTKRQYEARMAELERKAKIVDEMEAKEREAEAKKLQAMADAINMDYEEHFGADQPDMVKANKESMVQLMELAKTDPKAHESLRTIYSIASKASKAKSEELAKKNEALAKAAEKEKEIAALKEQLEVKQLTDAYKMKRSAGYQSHGQMWQQQQQFVPQQQQPVVQQQQLPPVQQQNTGLPAGMKTPQQVWEEYLASQNQQQQQQQQPAQSGWQNDDFVPKIRSQSGYPQPQQQQQQQQMQMQPQQMWQQQPVQQQQQLTPQQQQMVNSLRSQGVDLKMLLQAPIDDFMDKKSMDQRSLYEPVTEQEVEETAPLHWTNVARDSTMTPGKFNAMYNQISAHSKRARKSKARGPGLAVFNPGLFNLIEGMRGTYDDRVVEYGKEMFGNSMDF